MTDQEHQARMEKAAEALYDAYSLSAGGVNFAGDPLPVFADLPDNIRQNWLFTAAVAWHLFKESK